MNDHWLGIVPSLHIRQRLAKWMIVVIVYTLAVVAFERWMDLPEWTTGAEAGAILGFVIGILVVFRNNAAYDRWWEARKLWGQLINDSRNLLLKSRAHADAPPGDFAELGRLLVGFAHALRLHLRGVSGLAQIPGFENDQTAVSHAPGHIAAQVHQLLNRWNREGKLRDSLWVLDVHARALMDVCGACERIRNTPLASSYRALVRLALITYVLTAPWSVTLDLGLWAIPALNVGFFFLLGIELTAEDVEEPFGVGADELPLEDYCRTIETFVKETLQKPSESLKHG